MLNVKRKMNKKTRDTPNKEEAGYFLSLDPSGLLSGLEMTGLLPLDLSWIGSNTASWVRKRKKVSN